jgi:cysteine-rich repeat protein
MKCSDNVFTGDLANDKCRTTGDYKCTYCGDGIVQSGAGEECDGTAGVGDHQTCNSECKLVNQPYCGDSICNDGNDKTCEPDGTTKDMKCSDNVFTGDLANDKCRKTGDYKCTYCGDGIKQSGAGEECDGSDGVGPNQVCSDDCRLEQNLFCGDGVVQPPEQCELPNTENNEYCPQTTEECKDHKIGIRDSFGDCNANCGCTKDHFQFVCVVGQCGATCTEDSDCNDHDPHTTDTCKDDCSCQHEENPFCGDGIIQPPEECDDGNNVDGDGCSAVCTIEEVVPEFSPVGLILAVTIIGAFLIKRK